MLKKDNMNILKNKQTTLPNEVLLLFIFSLFFLGSHPRHREVPRLGVKSELQVSACITATATQDPSCICSLHHSSRQHWIRNPLSEARDQTHVLMDTSQVRYRWATVRTLDPNTVISCFVAAELFSCLQSVKETILHH